MAVYDGCGGDKETKIMPSHRMTGKFKKKNGRAWGKEESESSRTYQEKDSYDQES